VYDSDFEDSQGENGGKADKKQRSDYLFKLERNFGYEV